MEEKEKNKRGRPTKYKEEYCQQVIDYMAEGNSVTEFASEIGVIKSSVYEWAKVYPNFSNALNEARQKSQAYWEKELKKMMREQGVNSPLVKLYFANRFNWHDKQSLDHQSTDGSMTPKAAIDVSKLSDSALAEIMAAANAPDTK